MKHAFKAFLFAACAATSSGTAFACDLPERATMSPAQEIAMLETTGFLLNQDGNTQYAPMMMTDFDASLIVASILNLQQAAEAAHRGTQFHLRLAGLLLRDKQQRRCFFDAIYGTDEPRLINDMLIMSRALKRHPKALSMATALRHLTDLSSGAQTLTALQEMGIVTFPKDYRGQADLSAKPQLHPSKAAHLPNLNMRALATRLYKDTDTTHAIVYAIAGMGHGRN